MGGGPPDICAGILLAPEAEAWFIHRSSIVVNDPHDPAYLEATYCGANPDPNVRFFLTDPLGNTWELPAVGDRTYFEYELPPATSPKGHIA